MTSKIEARLAELGLALPPASQPLNAYQNVVIVNELAFVAGHASDLMFAVMGEAGRHARFAVGPIGPMDFTCSVEAIFQVKV